MARCRLIGRIDSCLKMSEGSLCTSLQGCIYANDEEWNRRNNKKTKPATNQTIKLAEDKN